MQAFGIQDYILPRLPIPPRFLSCLLFFLGRNNINPLCNYSQKKILELGFEKNNNFETKIDQYAVWYMSSSNPEHQNGIF